jgi:D-serine deaminase-like pyridoxal phosphate-dependent protein
MTSSEPDLLRSGDDLIGTPIEDLDTPALLVDRAALDRNLEKMAAFFRGRKCRLRPHFKNHKCATLARRQVEAGNTAGLTCAKLGEAEVLAQNGLTDVLIANQVLGQRKIARLAELAGRIHLTVAVDHSLQIAALSTAASQVGSTLGVLVEVDIGMGRCGVAPGEAALALARQVAGAPGLDFRGLQAYEGHLVHVDDFGERTEKVRRAMDQAVQTRRLLEDAGIPVGVISGGSTSTYRITAEIDGVAEIQAGTYPTMDWRYAELAPEFEIALSVLTRVISLRPGSAVLDVGIKGAGNEFGLPRIKDCPEAEIRSFSSEEHGIVHNPPAWRMGQTVHLIPSHACTTCNLYRRMILHADGRVTDVWPIEGSGKLA